MKYFLILLSALFLFCCKKKESIQPAPIPPTAPTPPIDTIKPRNYFPVYPGSYWTYLWDGITVETYSTSQTYVLSSYPVSTGSFIPVYTTLYDSQLIFGYEGLIYPVSHGGIPPPPYMYTFLTEAAGVCQLNFNGVYCDAHNNPFFCQMDVIHRIVRAVNSNNDSIIIALGFITNAISWPTTNLGPVITRREFTKNVGLTFYCEVDTVSHDTLQKKQLISYHIGPH